MAKPSSAARGKKAPVRVARVPANRLVVLLSGIALIPFSLPTVLVLFCGLLPTLGAAVGERGSHRYAWVCVGGLNFAGLIPWLFTLWFGHNTLDYAFHQVIDIKLYLTSFGAAAGGWLLYLATPPAVAALMAATSQRRGAALAAQQRKLIDQWGQDVISRPEPIE